VNLNLRRAVVRAMSAKLRRVPERGGAVLFLPLPLRRAAAALSLALLFGCTSAAKQVARYQNDYDYRESAYEEKCIVASPPSQCVEAWVALHKNEKHLHGAAKALKNGGPLPLQIKALKADAKALAKLEVTK